MIGFWLVIFTVAGLCAQAMGQGVVKEIAGDLAYVAGLNGDATLGSQLQVDEDGATLQVIKKLDDVLVARVVWKMDRP